jgi:hypothetical protein
VLVPLEDAGEDAGEDPTGYVVKVAVVVVIPDETVSVAVVVVVAVGEYEGQVGNVMTEEMESAVSVTVVICAWAAAASRPSRSALLGAIIMIIDVWYVLEIGVGGLQTFELEDGLAGMKSSDEGSGEGTYRPQNHGIMRGIVACHHKVTCCRVTSKDLAASQW